MEVALVSDLVGVRAREDLCDAVGLHCLMIVDEGQADVLGLKGWLGREPVAED